METVVVQYMSDLHLEWLESREKFPKIPVKSKILILAGDICTAMEKERLEEFLVSEGEKFEHVLFVPGNHEYYYSKISHTNKTLKEICDKIETVHFLNRKSVLIDEVKFLGCSLWTNIDKDEEAEVFKVLNDFSAIYTTDETKSLTLEDYRSLHETDLNWLIKELEQCRKKKERACVITHHPPIRKNTSSPKFEGSKTSSGFSNDLGEFITSWNDVIRVWVAGHTHHNFDVLVGNNVRVVSNQCGYLTEYFKSEKVHDFDVSKTLTI